MIVVDSFVRGLAPVWRATAACSVGESELPRDEVLPGRPAREPSPVALLAEDVETAPDDAPEPWQQIAQGRPEGLGRIDFKQDPTRATELLTTWLQGYEQRTGEQFPKIGEVLRRGQEPSEVHEVLSGSAGIDRLEKFLVQRGTIYRPVRAFQIQEDLTEPVRDQSVSAQESFARIPKQIDLGLLTNRTSGLAYGEVGYCGVLLRGWIEAREGDHEALLARLSDSDEMLAIHKHLYHAENIEETLAELSSFATATADIDTGTMVDHMKLHALAQQAVAAAPADGAGLMLEAIDQAGSVAPDDAASFLARAWAEARGLPVLSEAMQDTQAAAHFCRLLGESPEPLETTFSLAEIVGFVGSDHAGEAVQIQVTLDARVGAGEERESVLRQLLRGFVAPGGRLSAGISLEDDEVDIDGYRLPLRG